MHPARSVILFTTFSGIGFGLLFWLGLGLPAPTGGVAFVFFALAYLMSVGGLLASAFHLGHPERALKAFTQWRSSWLSREGVCSVAALIVMAIYGAGLVFAGTQWVAIGIIGAILSLGTIFTTSMIYNQLKTIPRWHHWSTPLMFLTFSLAGGALFAGQIKLALPLLAISGTVQLLNWIAGDKALQASGSTIATATGLGNIGSVRAFEPPHTGTNYLMNEMVYRVARKRAAQLRIIALFLGFGLPIALLLLPVGHWIGALAAISHIAGILASRWLFFAQAEHVVGLYYGAKPA
ncbi:dimethyl sulfoxide reductase anchor subunit family protein [Aestuariibius sp. HNIBRBA575]|uniref:dimethyl sulfoxide reductase anchor subunit family protein n=1 Tax=Aestuariibius sp. HNIBRBA575 TaxID=3233343 RepID=UPI0034A30C07